MKIRKKCLYSNMNMKSSTPNNPESVPPLEVLFDVAPGAETPLPERLAATYGPLRLPAGDGRPYIIANFVSTLDGVVSFGVEGALGGNAISGANKQDAAVMGLLRCIADVVITGAGNLRASPKHIWSPARVYPPFAADYAKVRAHMGKPELPPTVIVTRRSDIDPALPLLQPGAPPVLIVTSRSGAAHLATAGLPEHVIVHAVDHDRYLGGKELLDIVRSRITPCDTILVEGGPHLFGDLLAEHLVDELFLTLSPQLAGRDGARPQLALVEGKLFGPGNPLWGNLLSVRKGTDHLFLRYGLPGG
jgi:riboflavin biosynthesis pyrimidine reductase